MEALNTKITFQTKSDSRSSKQETYKETILDGKMGHGNPFTVPKKPAKITVFNSLDAPNINTSQEEKKSQIMLANDNMLLSGDVVDVNDIKYETEHVKNYRNFDLQSILNKNNVL